LAEWKVPRDWEGETVAVLASGPSMTREQADAVRGRCRVVAVNNQGIDTVCDGRVVPALAPWADVLYAADAEWWRAYAKQALLFAGLKVTIRRAHFKELLVLKQSTERVFDPRPDYLATGGNSGYQAVHLATHFGARRILLFGFDMRQVGKRKHWFGDHVRPLHSGGNYGVWIRNFTALAKVLAGKGVEVINCTPGSALTCFRSAALEEALA